ncbi:MAG: hypothetical protein RL653_223 [Pseudomonadota bacterium]|jgi:hypothetical protein
MNALPLLLLLSAAPASPAPPGTGVQDTLPDRVETFGGVLMPAVMPRAATSLYAYVGAPDVGGGFRQGFDGFELEARARFNYLLVSFTGELAGRRMLYSRGRFAVAARLALGGGYDTGTFYVDQRNFRGPFVHVNPGVFAAYQLHDTLRGFAQAEVPVDVGVQPVGGYRVTPLVGAGLEYYLSEEFSVMGSGEVGLDVLRAQLGAFRPTVGYGIKVGLGLRLF